MSENARFKLKVLLLGIIASLCVIYVMTGGIYHSIAWMIAPFVPVVSWLYHGIQSHPDGWFRWTVVAILANISIRLMRMHSTMQRSQRSTQWQRRRPPYPMMATGFKQRRMPDERFTRNPRRFDQSGSGYLHTD